ncbi:hypothetical protein, partial [Bacillus sp. AFS017336]|uniref:hypothetical protein n=1 Tax=Bacillus sp. AFS017336 TaxID=2033489 RepID=UPI000BFAB162
VFIVNLQIDITIDFLECFAKSDRPKGRIENHMIREIVDNDSLTYWEGIDENEPVITIPVKRG